MSDPVPKPCQQSDELLGPRVQRRTSWAWSSRVLVVSILGWTAGCATAPAAIEVIDHRHTGEVKRYRESFDEAFFGVDAAGNVELVLRRNQPSVGDTPQITQIVVIRAVWKCIPGTTIANRSQINGSVSYAVMSGRAGTVFEGAGSFICATSRNGDVLKGLIDGVPLQHGRSFGGGETIFERAVVSGEFRARRAPQRTRQIINDLDRLMGAHSGP